jgi:malonate-semialdehyde dehydrogenase (acetylating)/methylmalonate-semialdehyde dehydrogenase
VDALLGHDQVDAISFVGSTPIAKYVYETSAMHGKRVQALGGAKNHLVIMPDADMDLAVDGLMGAAFGSAGERCMAISVAVPVGEEVAEELIRRLVPKIRELKIGPGSDSSMDMGPLVTRQHLERVRGYIDLGVTEGAQLLVDGREYSTEADGGYFIGGSLFDKVAPTMRIYQEEIFGPVLAIVRVPSFDEATQLINTNAYGNGTAIFTRDGRASRRFAEEIQVGMVGVNVPIPVPVGFHSFGGWKASLFGDYPVYGPEGIRFYSKVKTVTTRWPESASGGADFVMPSSR